MTSKPTYEELEQRIKELEKEAAKSKQTEKMLRKVEERFRTIYEKSPIGIELYDSKGQLLHVNKACLDIFGVVDERQVKGFRLLDDPNLPHKAKERFRAGKMARFEIAFDFDLVKKKKLYDTTKSGIAYFDVIITPLIPKGNGEPGEYLVQVQDNTERRQAEEALKTEINKLETITHNIGAGLAIISKDYRTLWANQVLKEIFGKVEGKICYSTYNQLSDVCPNCGVREVFENGKDKVTHEEVGKDADGQTIWSEIIATPIRDKEGNVEAALELVVPITKRKKAEEELKRIYNELEIRVEERTSNLKKANRALQAEIVERKRVEDALKESEKRFRSIIEGTAAGYFFIDPGGCFQNVNKAWLRMHLFSSSAEVIGQHFSLTQIDADIEAANENVRKLLRGEAIPTGEFSRRCKDGSIGYHTFSVNPVIQSGKIIGFEGFIIDITDKKKLEAQLQQAQKLESVGILAGGIAHDFNNLISVIVGNIELAKDDTKPADGTFMYLSEAEKASLQAKELTRQLITFSKGGMPVKEVESIGDFLTETTNETLFGSNVKCEYFFPHDLWLVEIDKGQMKHAVKNLIVNSMEAMPNDGSIQVLAQNFEFSFETVEQSLSFAEGKYVKISIGDQGVGIPEEHLPMIFDPYFSTKELGIQKGMGLGLAATYSIINRHDGHITVESEVGTGTTFTLYLPAHEKDIRKSEPISAAEPAKPISRTGKILLMDDEEMIRNLGKQMLSRLGYDAVLAKDGGEAIELYRKAMDSTRPFDAVILDLTIRGGMGGKETVKKLLELNPHARTIVSSGYSNDPVMTYFKEYGFIGALPKPYSVKDLKDILNKVAGE